MGYLEYNTLCYGVNISKLICGVRTGVSESGEQIRILQFNNVEFELPWTNEGSAYGNCYYSDEFPEITIQSNLNSYNGDEDLFVFIVGNSYFQEPGYSTVKEISTGEIDVSAWTAFIVKFDVIEKNESEPFKFCWHLVQNYT